jgi:hypothetical protein
VTLHLGDRAHPNVEVGFMPPLSKTGHGLLGQYGFFNLYTVKFDFPQGQIGLVDRDGALSPRIAFPAPKAKRQIEHKSCRLKPEPNL